MATPTPPASPDKRTRGSSADRLDSSSLSAAKNPRDNKEIEDSDEVEAETPDGVVAADETSAAVTENVAAESAQRNVDHKHSGETQATAAIEKIDAILTKYESGGSDAVSRMSRETLDAAISKELEVVRTGLPNSSNETQAASIRKSIKSQADRIDTMGTAALEENQTDLGNALNALRKKFDIILNVALATTSIGPEVSVVTPQTHKPAAQSAASVPPPAPKAQPLTLAQENIAKILYEKIKSNLNIPEMASKNFDEQILKIMSPNSTAKTTTAAAQVKEAQFAVEYAKMEDTERNQVNQWVKTHLAQDKENREQQDKVLGDITALLKRTDITLSTAQRQRLQFEADLLKNQTFPQVAKLSDIRQMLRAMTIEAQKKAEAQAQASANNAFASRFGSVVRNTSEQQKQFPSPTAKPPISPKTAPLSATVKQRSQGHPILFSTIKEASTATNAGTKQSPILKSDHLGSVETAKSIAEGVVKSLIAKQWMVDPNDKSTVIAPPPPPEASAKFSQKGDQLQIAISQNSLEVQALNDILLATAQNGITKLQSSPIEDNQIIKNLVTKFEKQDFTGPVVGLELAAADQSRLATSDPELAKRIEKLNQKVEKSIGSQEDISKKDKPGQ